eukprot:NODE_10670_length_1336_cov_6.982630.p2 GENE.NODE_10670_length_1336_cov_6.982630~~NODE_10670_length_1336_cov_6.982630.p2  ORF type:complete len:103 (-),score=13.65 NODE_10670_length_1336_cov_6.982630:699-1007(-)
MPPSIASRQRASQRQRSKLDGIALSTLQFAGGFILQRTIPIVVVAVGTIAAWALPPAADATAATAVAAAAAAAATTTAAMIPSLTTVVPVVHVPVMTVAIAV